MHPYFIPLQQASYDKMEQKNKICILCCSGVCNDLFVSHINTPIWGTLTSKDTVSNLDRHSVLSIEIFLSTIYNIHYSPLMMSQKVAHRKQTCVLPKKVANDVCFLGATFLHI